MTCARGNGGTFPAAGNCRKASCRSNDVRNILFGAIAGIAATVVMTAAARRMHKRLPEAEKYALPPREITQHFTGRPSNADREREIRLLSIAAHFLFGSLAGGLFALQPRRDLASGSAYGAGVWFASYLGWIPLSGILDPANRHPPRRNLLMLSVHLAWGAALAASLRELEQAQRTIFGPLPAGLPDRAGLHRTADPKCRTQ